MSRSIIITLGIYLFVWLRQVSDVALRIFSLCWSMPDLVPDWGSTLGLLHWELGVLATRPLGKSLEQFV